MRFQPCVALLLGGLAAAGCSSDTSSDHTVPTEKRPPAVAITAPASGPVTGLVTIGVTASDSSGIATVQWKINGALLPTVDSTTPFEYAWNTTLNGPGTYAWTAVATDRAGNSAESAPVTYTVTP